MLFYILNRSEELLAILSNDNGENATVSNAVLKEQLNKMYSLELEVPVTVSEAQYLIEENYILFKDLLDEWQLYIIKEVAESHGESFTKTVYCENGSQELLDDLCSYDIKDSTETASTLLTNILSGTRWEVGNVSNVAIHAISKSSKNKSVLEAIHILREEYSLQIRFRYTVVGNSITHRYVDLLLSIGNDYGKRFEYTKDIESIERITDTTDLKTAIVPVGGMLEGANTPVDISSIEWTTSNNPLNKPAGQLYLEDITATNQWGYGTLSKRPRFAYYENTQVTDANVLIQEAYEILKAMSIPKVTYKMSVVDLYALSQDSTLSFESVKTGDLAVIVDKEFTPAITLKTAIIEREVDLLSPENTKITLGNYIETLADNSVDTVLEKVDQIIDNIDFSEFGNGSYSETQKLNDQAFKEAIGYTYLKDTEGLWVYDSPSSQTPTKMIALKGGMLGIGKWNANTQQWSITTFIDGDSVNASAINTGFLNTDRIQAGSLNISKLSIEVQNTLNDVENKADLTYVETEINTLNGAIELKVSKTDVPSYQNKTHKVRYIRNWIQGSTANVLNHWMEIKALSNTTNRAKSIVPTSNMTLNNASSVTDDDTATFASGTSQGLQYIQVDLGAIYEDIDYIQIWHYYMDNRVYHKNKVEISADGTNWTVMFDSDVTGEYMETSTGKTIPVNGGHKTITSTGTFNDEGLTVSHSQVGTISVMSADGFKIYSSSDTNRENVLGSLVGDTSSFSTLTVNSITAQNILTTQKADVTYYVDGSIGSDSNDGSSGTPFRTIQNALDKLNKIFDSSSRSANIYIYGECNEVVTVENFTGVPSMFTTTWTSNAGIKLIFDRGAVLNGNILVSNCTVPVVVYGGRTGYSDTGGALIKSTSWGTNVLQALGSTNVVIANIRVQGLGTTGGKNGIYVSSSGCRISHVDMFDLNIGVVVDFWSRVSFFDCVGSRINTGLDVRRASLVCVTNNSAFPNATTKYLESDAYIRFQGTVGYYDSFSSPSAIPSTTQYTKQWTTTQTQSWRDNYGWRTDNNYIYQGQYNTNGIHRGFMIFNSADIRTQLSGSTIKGVKLYLTRNGSGGNSASTNTYLWGHSYDSTGGGAGLTTNYGYIGGWAWSEAKWVSLPISIGNDLKSGAIHGLALYASSLPNSYYSVFAGSAKLEITYVK